ncbi:MAG: sugar phosphate isomerase/epimerase [Planctomycetaceae bacterium]|nr:sugar phosphate isomerase/epimerase [Planctomycetaceae bacterium]
MITISAFADEIGPDLALQMQTCAASGVRHIDVRGIDGVNVSKFTPEQAKGYRRRLDDGGFAVPCIGSPIGKITMDDDFEMHLDLLRHCFEIADIFGTRLIRVFSFYSGAGKNIADQRTGVMDRMAAMVRLAEADGFILMHENEKAIYGARPAGVRDLLTSIRAKNLLGVFDPANYVEEGVRPYDEGWAAGLAEMTQYFHVKDKDEAKGVCVPAGTGDGQFAEIFADMARRGWSGVATLEPHLAAAGQFTGHTGPQMFATAAKALQDLCTRCGLEYC